MTEEDPDDTLPIEDSVAAIFEDADTSVEAPRWVLESLLESKLNAPLTISSIDELRTVDADWALKTVVETSIGAEVLGDTLEAVTERLDNVDTASVSIEDFRSSDEETKSMILEGLSFKLPEKISELEPAEAVEADDGTAISEVKTGLFVAVGEISEMIEIDTDDGDITGSSPVDDVAKREVCTISTLAVEIKIRVSALENTSMLEIEIEGTGIDSESDRLERSTEGAVKLEGAATGDVNFRSEKVVTVDSVIEMEITTSEVGKMRLDSDALKVGIGMDGEGSIKIEDSTRDDCKLRLIEGLNVGTRVTVGVSSEIEDASIVDGKRRLDNDLLTVGTDSDDRISLDIEGTIIDVGKIKVEEEVALGSRLDVGTSMEIEDIPSNNETAPLMDTLSIGIETDVGTSTEGFVVEIDISELEIGVDG
ncbi:hypothetical protein BKA65DRAFT_482730 [Rhexocercosporidium sp. MPI-PUGE-AT-0058]|nr:hypothetical protein BKA65DRAFT_482730 [Rhexocercosporidium sp. MPI-PUGE-AT-0058]